LLSGSDTFSSRKSRLLAIFSASSSWTTTMTPLSGPRSVTIGFGTVLGRGCLASPSKRCVENWWQQTNSGCSVAKHSLLAFCNKADGNLGPRCGVRTLFDSRRRQILRRTAAIVFIGGCVKVTPATSGAAFSVGLILGHAPFAAAIAKQQKRSRLVARNENESAAEMARMDMPRGRGYFDSLMDSLEYNSKGVQVNAIISLCT
jgi:hypothetical protein